MPELDYALLCDYVRTEGGVAHLIAAGVDTVYAPQVPTGRNLGVLTRFTFTRSECDRPHRVEFVFQDTDGATLAKVEAVLTPAWVEGLPAGWKTGALFGLNLGLPLPKLGEYALEILVNDSNVKSLQLRVVPQPGQEQAP